MRLCLLLCAACVLSSASVATAATAVELEVATEQGVQITAPQEWLQLLAAIGIDHVRIRTMRAGDEPRVVDRGKAGATGFRVIGILTSGDQLRLPGRTFTRDDRAKLKDYLAGLVADGPESLTATRGLFGLTDKEMQAVFADFTQPVNFETKGQPLRVVLDQFQSRLSSKFGTDVGVERQVQGAAPFVDDVKNCSAGTALAMVLRSYGLAMRPEKTRGQPVVYWIARADAETLRQSTLGRLSGDDAAAMKNWPIGWEFNETPGDVAPSLSEFLNAEIDGYTLAEALAAIGPRVKISLYFDHAVLKAKQIDPARLQVKMTRTRTSYRRVIDRLLAQARLGSQLRVDEAGTPFLWITH
jgi:hypothetical protein